MQSQRCFCLSSPTSSNHVSLLHKTPYYTLSIMQTSLGFTQDKFIRSPQQDRHSLTRIVNTGKLDNFRRPSLHEYVRNILSLSKLICFHLIGMSHGLASESSTDEFNIVSVNVGHHENTHLGQKVKGQFIVGISQYRLLNQQDIRTRLFDCFALTQNKFSFLSKDTIHGCVITHYYIVVHIRLGCGQAILNEGNLCIVHTSWATSCFGCPLGQHQTIHEFGIINGST
mmetsp:Transcript_90/g.213  ORF Transcript_90/g.213 Transcript_90/m.213 type:complete len:227 (-) Transcript_90:700-1380(-)